MSELGQRAEDLLRDFLERGRSPSNQRMWTDAVTDIARQQELALSVIGVNGQRVDLHARAGDREWRIVYGTSDGANIEWLSTHERGPAFEGVPGGRAVVFNGASGAGKSSAMRAIASTSTTPWVLFDEPVLGEVRQSHLIWRQDAEPLHRGFLDGIAALARAGNCVATSAAGMPMEAFDRAFAGIPTLYVGLRCDLATLLEREQGREGRWGGLAEASLRDLDPWMHDLEFDTAITQPEEIAARVLEAIEVATPR